MIRRSGERWSGISVLAARHNDDDDDDDDDDDYLCVNKQAVYFCLTRLFEIEIFDYLTECKQMTFNWIDSNT